MDTLNNIKSKVKSQYNMFDDTTKLYLSFLLPLLIILVYLLYRQTFTKKNFDKLRELDYKSRIELKDLPKCQDLDDRFKHKLVDYYIASSFNTPCIGDQHYDYVSKEMIVTALESGARYIQLPICQEEVYYESGPCVGTAEKGKLMVTSLNSINLLQALNEVLAVAFKNKENKINYPLFIHLKLYTDNEYTLNIVADNIKSVFGELLLKPDKYYDFPIGLEQVCKLLNKVIIFCSDKYQNSKLNNIVVPFGNLHQELHYTDIQKFNVMEENYYKNEYHIRLSEIQQDKSNKLFTQMYPSIESIIKKNKEFNDDNTESNEITDVKNDILNNDKILNKLKQFNKIGITIIEPHTPEEVKSKNYDFMEPVKFGCQFIAMNYQINDSNMNKYIYMFKDSSFRLKPSGLRYQELNIETPDIEAVYDKAIKEITVDNIDTTFKYKFNNKLVMIESFSSPGEYMLTLNNSLKFVNINGSSKVDQLRNCFIIMETDMGDGNYNFSFQSINPDTKVITNMNLNSQDIFKLDSQGDTMNIIEKQNFYPLNPNNKESGFNSFKLINNNKPLYLGYLNKNLRGYRVIDNVDSELLNNTSFKLHIVDHIQELQFITLVGKGLYGFNNGIVGLKQNLFSTYQIIKSDSEDRGDTRLEDLNIYLKNNKNDKYLKLLTSDLLGEENVMDVNLDESNTFILRRKMGYFTLLSMDGTKILSYTNDTLSFKPHNKVKSSESMLRIKRNFVLK